MSKTAKACARVARALYVRTPSSDVMSAANLEEMPLPAVGELETSQVLVQMLASPINPADVMTIMGIYNYAEKPPYVVGLEGVGRVEEVGSNVKNLAVGDWVIPGFVGKWRTLGVCDQSRVIKVDKEIGFKAAATLAINPSTAYFMLKDPLPLKAGDTVIQNGANSAVGKLLIQLARGMGIKTINVVRDRPNIAELKAELKALGGDVVVTDKELQARGQEDPWDGGLAKPRLAIDCVSGEVGVELSRHLVSGGTLLNYGAMTGKPLQMSPLDLIFRKIKVEGYWLTNTEPARVATEAIPFITKLLKEGKLRLPEFELFRLDDYKSALKQATAGFTNNKQLLVMDDSLMK